MWRIVILGFPHRLPFKLTIFSFIFFLNSTGTEDVVVDESLVFSTGIISVVDLGIAEYTAGVARVVEISGFVWISKVVWISNAVWISEVVWISGFVGIAVAFEIAGVVKIYGVVGI